MSNVRKTGDWDKVQKVVYNLKNDMQDARKQGLMKVSLKAEALAVKHIKNQDLNWESLKQNTVKRKAKKGWSNKTLIASSDYMQSITRFVTDDTAFAGVKKDASNRDGTKITSIAAVHEFGYDNIPARPLWRPTFKETMEWVKKNNIFGSIAVKNIKGRT